MPETRARIALACRLVLACVFAWMFVSKLDAVSVSAHGIVRGPFAFASTIAGHGLIGSPWSSVSAWSVLVIEVGLIAWLISACSPRRALIATLAFIVVLSAYLGSVAGLSGSATPCGCSGSSSETVATALLRNAVLASIAGFGLMIESRRK